MHSAHCIVTDSFDLAFPFQIHRTKSGAQNEEPELVIETFRQGIRGMKTVRDKTALFVMTEDLELRLYDVNNKEEIAVDADAMGSCIQSLFRDLDYEDGKIKDTECPKLVFKVFIKP
jgi:hypothetical protein